MKYQVVNGNEKKVFALKAFSLLDEAYHIMENNLLILICAFFGNMELGWSFSLVA